MAWDAALYLENGHLFEGLGFGARKASGGEIVFNTGLTGYQEIFTDLSYCDQIVVMGCPLIGNTGINPEDLESGRLALSGVVAREYCPEPSNWRASGTLDEYLERAGVPAIHDVDTREITRVIRDEGAQRAVIFAKAEAGSDLKAHAIKLLKDVKSMQGLELVSGVSCREPYEYTQGAFGTSAGKVVVYDFGVKLNILRGFRERGFGVTVVPYDTPHQEVLKMNPTAVVLTNGPGDPGEVPTAPKEIEKLVGKLPIFAICMGHQLLARALGCETYKLKFGHHGVNHPVLDKLTGKILITSQNHGFCVREEDIKRIDGAVLSHVNLNDQTVEGFVSQKMRLYSVQFHPESKPGPSDARTLFDEFMQRMLGSKSS